MTRIADRIVNRIKEEGIKPIDKRIFILRRSFLWGILGINFVFGSISFSILIFMFENTDIQKDTPIEFIILSIPILWVILTIFSLILGYINIISTKDGYKFEFFKIFAVNIFFTIVFGSLLYFSGASSLLNNFLSENVHTYNQIADPRYTVWNSIESGQIAGEILSIDTQNKTLTLKDLSGEVRSIDFSNARVRTFVDLVEGSRVKVRGSFDGNIFEASDVLPWEGRGRNMQGNHF